MSEVRTASRVEDGSKINHTNRSRWTPPTGSEVRALREKLHLTQQEFSDRFGIEINSLRNWEQGRNVPEGTARQIFWMIEADPAAALKLIRKAAGRHSSDAPVKL